jgi:hypothetical protein
MSPGVRFNDADRVKAARLVVLREAPKRQHGVATKKVSEKHTDWAIDYYGVLAEMAVAKILDIELEEKRLISGDDGYDLVWKEKTIDVKFTFYRSGQLIIPDYCALADLYILMTGNDFEMFIVGWATKDMVERLSSLVDFGYGPKTAMKQDDLMRWDEFEGFEEMFV